jgi:hypothetical protein
MAQYYAVRIQVGGMDAYFDGWIEADSNKGPRGVRLVFKLDDGSCTWSKSGAQQVAEKLGGEVVAIEKSTRHNCGSYFG